MSKLPLRSARHSRRLKQIDVKPLLKTLDSEQREVRQAGMRAIVQLPLTHEVRNEVEAHLVKEIDLISSSPTTRDAAQSAQAKGKVIDDVIEASVQLPSLKARRAVRKLLNADQVVIRRAAARALALSGDPASRNQLIQDLSSESDDELTVDIAEQLANLDVAPVREEVEALFQNEERAEVRFWLAIALAAAGRQQPLESVCHDLRQGKVTFEYFPPDPQILADRLRSPLRVSDEIQRWLERFDQGADVATDVDQLDVILTALRTAAEEPQDVVSQVEEHLLSLDVTPADQEVDPLARYQESPFDSSGQLTSEDVRDLAQVGRDYQGKLVSLLFNHLIEEVQPGASQIVAGNAMMALLRMYGLSFVPDIRGLVDCFWKLDEHNPVAQQVAWTLGRAEPEKVIEQLETSLTAGDAGESTKAARCLEEMAASRERPEPFSGGGGADRGGHGPATDDLESEMNTATGHVNFEFTDVTLAYDRPALELHQGFHTDHRYRMDVSIGSEMDMRAEPGAKPVEICETGEADLQVVVVIDGDELVLEGKAMQPLKWDIAARKSNKASFQMAAKANSSNVRVTTYFFHSDNLLYTSGLTIEIKPHGDEWPPDGRPIRWRKRDHRSALYQTIHSLNSRRRRKLTVAVEPGRKKDTYNITGFIGTAEYHARATFKRAELIDHLVEVRGALDGLRRSLHYVKGGYDDEGTYQGRYTAGKGLYDSHGTELPQTDPEAEFEKFIKGMAAMGWRFYDDVFRGADGKFLRNKIQEHASSGDTIQIWIDDDAKDFMFPWAWVYTDEVKPGRRFKVQVDKFWGYRYILELLPQFPRVRGRMPPPAEFVKDDGIDVKMGVYNLKPMTGNQQDFFQKAAGEDESLTFEVWKKPEDWEQFLPEPQSQVLYFLCHGHTAKPKTLEMQAHYDMLGRWKEWLSEASDDEPEALAEYRKEGIKVLKELEKEGNLLQESFLKLTNGYLRLRQLRDVDLTEWSPLVFLNICESAQVFPHISEGFVDTFLKAGARGVLGTEIPMVPAFADLFARRLFDSMFHASSPQVTGQERSAAEEKPRVLTVGEALLHLRRQFLDAGNPLGFAYTYFGNVDTRLDVPLATLGNTATTAGS